MGKWEAYSKQAKQSTGGGLFARLKSGDSVKFVVIGDPHESHKLFPEDGGKPRDVEPGTPGATCQILIPIYDTERKSSRILQLTPRTFTDLAERIAEFGDDHTYRVKRTGEGMQTRYAVDHIGDTTKALLDQARGQDPLDLEQYGGRPMALGEPEEAPKPKAKPTGRPSPMPAAAEQPDEDIPF